MPAFRVSGSTGQAPTTSYFGTVPDRLTMTYPGTLNFVTIANAHFNRAKDAAANLLNAFSPQASSFGATTTAPDGSSNAQKLVEDSSNGFHCATSGFGSTVDGATMPLRMSVFLKAAERTRAALYVGNFGTDKYLSTASIGAKVVFDLAGGQVGVAPSSWNAGGSTTESVFGIHGLYTGLAAEIVAFGNGWYLCMFDFTVYANFDRLPMFFQMCIDAGSGTGAEMTQYVGNGTSGLYGWKASVLPQAAWGLNNRVFFDDFTDPTMGNIDLANTAAPGFNWYIRTVWPGVGFAGDVAGSPTPAGLFSQSGSTLTIAAGGTNSRNYTMSSAVYNGAGGFTGRGFVLPALVESNFGFDWASLGASASQSSFWLSPLNYMAAPGVRVTGNEFDIMEIPIGSIDTNNNRSFFSSVIVTSANGTGVADYANVLGKIDTTIGYMPWGANFNYGSLLAHLGGVIYQPAHNSTGDPPPSGNWTTFTPAAPFPTQANSNLFSLGGASPKHLWSALILPSIGGNNGWFLIFFDNVFVDGIILWGPVHIFTSNETFTIQHVADGTPWALMFTNDRASPTLAIDYVSVIQ